MRRPAAGRRRERFTVPPESEQSDTDGGNMDRLATALSCTWSCVIYHTHHTDTSHTIVIHRISYAIHRIPYLIHSNTYVIHRGHTPTLHSYAIHRMSYVIYHMSYVPRRIHTSYIACHISCITCRTSVISHVIRHTLHVIRHTSHIIHHTSHVIYAIHRMSYVCPLSLHLILPTAASHRMGDSGLRDTHTTHAHTLSAHHSHARAYARHAMTAEYGRLPDHPVST